MALSSLSHFKFRPPNVLEPNKSPYTDMIHTSRLEILAHKNTTVSRIPTSRHFHCLSHGVIPNRLRNFPSVLASASGDATSDPGGEISTANDESSASVLDAWRNRSSSSGGDGYVASFVSKLGLDNDPQDREQAVEAIWAYALQGKHFVDNVMKYNRIVNLVVNLLQSDSESACEAAAGFLRTLSSVNEYRDVVAECGAIEEITGLLRRSSLSSYVKEQAIGTLWNMSFDEKFRLRIANSDSFPMLVKFLEDDNLKVKEAVVGVLANVALSQSNHEIMVEAGVIPKLSKLLKDYADEPEVIGEIEAVMQKMNSGSKESAGIEEAARNALLELAKDEYNRVLIMEEGLLLVPLVGAAAYKCIKPFSYLQDQKLREERPKETKRRSRRSYGAEEIFLGLKTRKDTNLDEAKMNAKMAKTRQEFLARIGAIEISRDNEPKSEGSARQRLTILPWSDAVARLVLIMGLEDESAIAAAAGSIADACINEHVRLSFREAGAVELLVQLINHNSDAVKAAAVRALDRLSISVEVCKTIEAEGVLHPLINLLKNSVSCHTLTGMILNILTRVLDPNKEMKSKFFGGLVNDSKKDLDLTEIPAAAKENEMISSTSTSSLQIDSTFLSCLVDILKTSGLELRRKAASILEFIAMTKPHTVLIISEKIEAGLQEVLAQKSIIGKEYDVDDEEQQIQHILQLEEVGRTVSAASRLLARLLDNDEFRQTANLKHFIDLLRDLLVSPIPVQHKEWIAACLVKLSSFSPEVKKPIKVEVTLHEAIPRLVEKLENSFSREVQEAAVVELNGIISEGLVESTKAVASLGGIFLIVKLMEFCSDEALEASLAILYNLSMDGENHAAILAAGAVPILRKIVQSERPGWMRALRLLRTLPT